jgi:hypothetical protein
MHHAKHRKTSSKTTRRKITQRAAITAVTTLGLTLGGPVSGADAGPGGSVLTGVMVLADGTRAMNAEGCLTLIRSMVSGDSPTILYFTTNQAGEFNVPMPALTEAMAEEAAFNGGTLNFELTGMANESGVPIAEMVDEAVAAGSVLLYDGVYTFAAPLIGIAEPGASAALAMPNEVVLVLSDTTSMALHAPTNPDSIAGDPDDACNARGRGSCGYWTGWTETSRRAAPTVLGELHTYQDMWGHFHYSQAANSDIGVVHKMDTSAWKSSGEIHIGNTTGVTNSGVPYASYRGTEIVGNFNYVHETSDRMCWGEVMATRQRIRATVWNGDVFPGENRAYNDGYYTYQTARDEGCARCGRFIPGQKWSRDTTKTKKYAIGAGPFGVTVSSQTSYNTTHRVAYSFGYNVGVHWLIGNDGPPSSAGVIWAY